ncbi:EAL domain-containing protein [Aliivibrio sifiae]|uniref:EAL domain-containing protein n=1 Tax=Aliivibrio sifiae TaxID=566293 RepID=UPI003D0E2EA0
MNFKLEKIFDRYGKIYAYEILLSDSSQIDWVTIDCHWLNSNVYSQLNYLLRKGYLLENNALFCTSTPKNNIKFFVNIERRQLKSISFLNILSGCIDKLRENKVSIFLEITERDSDFEVDINYLNKLKRKFGFLFVADDVVEGDARKEEIENGLYDVVKVESSYITNGSSRLREEILAIKQNFDCKFLAEKIETNSMHKEALSLPIDYFQGYLYP